MTAKTAPAGRRKVMTDSPENWPKEKLIEFLAVEVMGWEYGDVEPTYRPPLKAHWKVDGIFQASADWNPLTDANDRDMLVEKMREKGLFVMIRVCEGAHSPYDVWIFSGRESVFVADADTPGEAVCIAAVKAVIATKQENSNE